MEFTIKREALIDVLGEYANILRDVAEKPILSGIKIKAEGDNVTFIGANRDVSHIRRVKAEVSSTGSFVIKPSSLLEYVKLVEEKDIKFSLENSTVFVQDAQFNIMSDEAFPSFTENAPVVAITMPGNKFVSLLEKSKYASSQASKNMAFNCLRVSFSPDNIIFVTTDSYRLLYLKDDMKCQLEKEVSIPVENVNIMCKLLKEYTEDVTIGFDADLLVVSWENAYFTSKTIAMSFPDFRGLVSRFDSDKTMEFNIDELKRALRSVNAVTKNNSDSKYGAIFDFREKMLEMSAISGGAKIKQKVNSIKEGDDFRASLNCKFIYEFLDNIKKNPILKGKDKKSMFMLSESGNDKYLCLIMPLAMKE